MSVIFLTNEDKEELIERISDIENAGGGGSGGSEDISEEFYKAFLNPANMIKNPLVLNKDDWSSTTAINQMSTNTHNIVETDTIANGFEIISTSGAYLTQWFNLSDFVSGKYVASYKKRENDRFFRFEIDVMDDSTSKNIVGISNTDHIEFDLDIESIKATMPNAHKIRFMLKVGYTGTFVLSEFYLAPYNENYNGFWHPLIGDKVTKDNYKILSDKVDNQSEAVNPLYGKIITFNGDSICESRSTNGGGYARIIGENNNMTVENLGVSGATVMYSGDDSRHCISRTITNMREDADYIILEGGVNDLYSERPLGTISNGYNATLDDTTFYGAFENMLKQALIRFPGKKIGYIAVHKMTHFYDSDGETDNAYHAAIKCCKKWGVPVCDLNLNCPPFGYLRENPETVFIANTYTEDSTTEGVGDGWHPNEEGYRKYYVPKIEAWLKTL